MKYKLIFLMLMIVTGLKLQASNDAESIDTEIKESNQKLKTLLAITSPAHEDRLKIVFLAEKIRTLQAQKSLTQQSQAQKSETEPKQPFHVAPLLYMPEYIGLDPEIDNLLKKESTIKSRQRSERVCVFLLVTTFAFKGVLHVLKHR